MTNFQSKSIRSNSVVGALSLGHFPLIAATVLSTLALSSSAQAVLIVGQQQFNAGNVLPSPIIAVSGDLLETSVLSVTGENAGANVRNGTTGTAHNPGGSDPAAVWGQTTTTYNLDVSINTLGYDISEISLFSGWVDGRAAQSYELFYSLVGNAAFTSLGAISAIQSNGSLLTHTYDNLGAAILSGVDAIRFTQIDNGLAGTGTVFREFDVIGVETAFVPEPGTFAMLLFGTVGLRLMRRKQS